MENLFSDLEGLRISIEIETRGREFYDQAYQQASQPAHKELFLLLKNEEIHHQEKFTQIYNVVKTRKEAHADDYLFDPDTSRYLTVIAEHHVFPKPADAARKIAELKSVQAILTTALQAEKDSVLFYDELAAHAKFDESRQIFAALKAEEQTHVVKIREMMDAWA
jgi:rubrerythrin